MLEILLRIAGVGLVLLAMLHVFFPRRFAWRTDLAGISLLNRQIFYVHTLFIAATVAFFGILSYAAADALSSRSTILALLMAGFTVFWFARLVVQLFVFDMSLWRGHAFNTAMHVLFTALWIALSALYGWAWWVVTH